MKRKTNQNEWIEGYADTVYNLLRTHDAGTHMPFNGFNFHPLFDKLLIERLYKAVKKLRDSNISIADIINFLPNHSSLKFNLLKTITDLKTSETRPEIARLIIDFFIEAIKFRATNEKFWEDNIVKDYLDTAKVLVDKKIVAANNDVSSELARIIAGCGSLVHGLYNDFWTDFGYEVFGPYKVSGDDRLSLFVRQFNDLRPVEIWPEVKNFPFKKIYVYAVYKNVESESHYIGCHMVYKQNLVKNLTAYQLEVDGHFVNLANKLKEMKEIILKEASEHYVRYKKHDFEKQKIIWLYQYWYQFKNLFDKIDMEWRPSEEMFSAVRNKKLVNYIGSYDMIYEDFCEKFGINYLRKIYK